MNSRIKLLANFPNFFKAERCEGALKLFGDTHESFRNVSMFFCAFKSVKSRKQSFYRPYLTS